MSDQRTLGLLVLAVAAFALVRLLQRARLSRSHRNVGGLAVATVAAGVEGGSGQGQPDRGLFELGRSPRPCHPWSQVLE